jgi:hypothetical protein
MGCCLSRPRTSDDPEPPINCLSLDPSTTSRLGDIGFFDKNGSWRRIFNILDQESADPFGIATLTLPKPASEYVEQTEGSAVDEPLIQLDSGGSYKLLTAEEVQLYAEEVQRYIQTK